MIYPARAGQFRTKLRRRPRRVFPILPGPASSSGGIALRRLLCRAVPLQPKYLFACESSFPFLILADRGRSVSTLLVGVLRPDLIGKWGVHGGGRPTAFLRWSPSICPG